MTRRELTALALGTTLGLPAVSDVADAIGRLDTARLPDRPLRIPADGVIRTAFTIGPGTNVIDLAGAWEVFQDAVVARAPGRFELFTVARDTGPVQATGGLQITATYAFRAAPSPHVVVVPAHQSSVATLAWLRRVAPRADLVMSVCTGAFVLAEAGLLDGKTATTHHDSYDDLAASYPKVHVVRGRRFVEHERIATAGGLTSGIDLALRVVERYLGRTAAAATARYMEYRRAS